ncbi:PAS domain S-box protein [Anabaena sp. PCC 7108]|uniref:PAS domain S-box protein n=1 Tax=Anabaena sp. PCC 7108 TaxID=163908 RepID=UPI00034DE974|nr:PAS domain S-box protein [Anabaena sp. PCC 7108]
MQASPHHFLLQSLESVIDLSPLTVALETPILDAIALMAAKSQGVLVKSASDVVGCLTQQDIVRLVATGTDLKTAQVAEVMQKSVIKLNIHTIKTLDSVISWLCQPQFQLIAVVDEDGEIIGTITPESICLALSVVEAEISNPRFVSSCPIVEHQLLQSPQILQLIIDTIPHSIFWKDINSVFLGCNRNFAKMVDFDNPENIIGKTDYDLLSNHEEAQFYCVSDAEIMRTNQPQYQTITPKQQADGSQMWLETNKVPLYNTKGEVVGIFGTLENITERKQAQDALKISEERFRNLVETSSDWIWEVDENCIYTYVSPKVRDILGYEPQEVLGKTPFELMPPAEAERVMQIFAPIAAERQSFKCLENTNCHQDGHLVVLETNGLPIFDVEGRFRGYRGIDRDITARKQEAAALWETQQQLHAILDNLPAVMYLLDTENKYLLVNRQYEKLFKTTQDQVVGKSVYDIWSDDIAKAFAVSNSQVIAGGIPLESEEVVPHEDGLHTYWSVKFPLKDANGVSYAICGISTDITDRKRTQEELYKSEESFRLLVEGVKDYAIYMLDQEGLVRSWNSGAECITGYQAAEIIGQNFSCFFPPEDVVNSLPKQQLDIAAGNGRCECESVFVRKDGSYFWANCILTALRDQTGQLRGFSKVTRDITERKLAEKSLLRLLKAIESTSDAVSIADISGQLSYVNSAFIDIFDYTESQLNADEGLSTNFHTKEVFKRVIETVHRGESWRGEVIMQSRSGESVHIDLRTDAIKDDTGMIVSVVSIYTDITQRKLIEEGLRLRDRAIAASSNGIVIADVTSPDSSIIYVNPAFERLTGYSADEVIGQNFLLIQSSDINQPGLQELSNAMQLGQDCTVILRNSCQDGSIFWHELNISPVYDADGYLTHYIGIQTDITERQQTETALLVSQERLQYLLTCSPAVIYASKAYEDFGAIFISENVQAMIGYEAREFTQSSDFWFSHIHPEDAPKVIAELSRVLGQTEYTLEYRFLHQDGIYRWVYDQGKVVWDEAGNPLELVGYWADITTRKQLEQELRVALETEKELNELKSRFISMTSHEFRTPLSTILSSSELLEHYSHKWTHEKQLTHLHRIQAAVNRMTEMLNDILVIGKGEAGKLEYRPLLFDLVKYCRQLVEEVSLNLKSQHLVYFSSPYESVCCYMDEKLLGHILNNLLSNALKYSPDGSLVNFTLTCQDGQAVFEIKDQGIGIPEEDMPRLFESFHRARNVGNILGTGLGLAIVKKCVDIHQGTIYVNTLPGVGSSFTVTLPLKQYHMR